MGKSPQKLQANSIHHLIFKKYQRPAFDSVFYWQKFYINLKHVYELVIQCISSHVVFNRLVKFSLELLKRLIFILVIFLVSDTVSHWLLAKDLHYIFRKFNSFTKVDHSFAKNLYIFDFGSKTWLDKVHFTVNLIRQWNFADVLQDF